LERLGCNPIEKLLEIAQMNIDAYKSGRGLSEKGDSGPSYLANATRVYIELAKFKHPTLSAVAIKDMADHNEGKAPLSTAAAIEVLKADAFAPNSFKEIPTEKILDAMSSGLNAPFLPSGKKE
jgi:hypothetical protein